ncbi:MAG: hypothetical protein ACI9FB_002579 [Candidatus Azotimanducaceae bacterium]|jgi:hypothetical protein
MIEKLIFTSLILLSITQAFAAESEQSGTQSNRENPNADDYRNAIPRAEALAEMAEDANRGKPKLPFLVPTGWYQDYDYESPIGAYLNRVLEISAKEDKNTYIYLYADWLENCREFRKKADKFPYKSLFEKNNIILIEYNFFKRKFNMTSRNLPMIIKVNEGGKLGPETINPVLKANQHPKKTFYKLQKFFEE